MENCIKNKTALISGGRGMDASNLADFLLAKDYTVVSFDRRVSIPDHSNIEHILDHPNYTHEEGDITDFGSITRLLKQYNPDEYYNLAAMSHVHSSWQSPLSTLEINFNGVANALEAIRLFSPQTKFYQASTSERYGDVISDTQNEDSPTRARSPYAASKIGAESLVKVYKESYNLFATYGILFNHSGSRRSVQFVERKITNWIGKAFVIVEKYILNSGMRGFVSTQHAFEKAIEDGVLSPLELGSLDPIRDFCDSRDMVRGMWMILQHHEPDVFVLGSGRGVSIREILNICFAHIGITDWSKMVVQNPKFFRPADVNLLCADYTKAKNILGWEPTISLEQMLAEMVDADIQLHSDKPALVHG